jgi:aspartyl-tRNA(Asn)/glutamyl-tRNA(Gln) amidotransferase subunit C
MDWIEQLAEVNVDGVEPMTSAVSQPAPLRDDVVTEGGDPERVLANAPRRAGDFFVVPKVVE